MRRSCAADLLPWALIDQVSRSRLRTTDQEWSTGLRIYQEFQLAPTWTSVQCDWRVTSGWIRIKEAPGLPVGGRQAARITLFQECQGPWIGLQLFELQLQTDVRCQHFSEVA